MKTTDKIYQNALEINSMSLQIIAWINEIRSKQDQIVAIPTRHTPQSREDSALTEIADCQLNNVIQTCTKIKNDINRQNNGIIFSYKEIRSMPKSLQSLFKEGKIKANVRKRENGTYEVRCKVNSIAVSASSKSYDTAKSRFIDKLFEIHNNELLGSYNIPYKNQTTQIVKQSANFNEYAAKWLEIVKKPYIKETTYNAYVTLFNSDLLPAFGKCPINRIKQIDLQVFINRYTEKELFRTAQKLYQLLNALFEYAVSDEIINRNPMKLIKIPVYEQEHGIPLTRTEEKEFILNFRKSNDLFFQAYVLMIYTGIRRSEIHSLNYNEEWIIVTTAKQRKGKTEKQRKIPISPMLKNEISRIKIDEIKKLPLDGLTRNFKKICPTHHLHDLRHTFITRCQECGIQREIVSLWAGHAADSSVTSTVYTHLEQYTQNQIAEIKKFSYILQ